MPGERYKAPIALLAMLISSDVILAQESGEVPEDDFLEFLGEWESTDGSWVDPLEFAEYEIAEHEQECDISDEKCLQQRHDRDES